jgi:hypothetical protein
MAEMMRNVGHRAVVSQFLTQRRVHLSGVHPPDELGRDVGPSLAGEHAQLPVQLGRRVFVIGDAVHLADRHAADLQAGARRPPGHAAIMLAARDPLLLNGGHQLAAGNQGRGGVVEESRYSEHSHRQFLLIPEDQTIERDGGISASRRRLKKRSGNPPLQVRGVSRSQAPYSSRKAWSRLDSAASSWTIPSGTTLP